jgi:hypothetical protein
MYKTILKMAWPQLQGFLTKRAAEYAADYLQTRREQRLREDAEQEIDGTSSLQEVEDDPVIVVLEAPRPHSFWSSDAFWFTLSGILLGFVLSIVAYVLIRED